MLNSRDKDSDTGKICIMTGHDMWTKFKTSFLGYSDKYPSLRGCLTQLQELEWRIKLIRLVNSSNLAGDVIPKRKDSVVTETSRSQRTAAKATTNDSIGAYNSEKDKRTMIREPTKKEPLKRRSIRLATKQENLEVSPLSEESMSELESVHKKSCYDSVEQSKEFSERDCYKVMGILFSTSAYCTIKSQANDLEIIKPVSYEDLKTEIYAQERMETHMRSNSSKRKSAITSESNVQTTLNIDQVQRFKFCNKTGQCWHKKSSINALNGNQQRMVNPANFTPRQDLGETGECTSKRRGISYSAREVWAYRTGGRTE